MNERNATMQTNIISAIKFNELRSYDSCYIQFVLLIEILIIKSIQEFFNNSCKFPN